MLVFPQVGTGKGRVYIDLNPMVERLFTIHPNLKKKHFKVGEENK